MGTENDRRDNSVKMTLATIVFIALSLPMFGQSIGKSDIKPDTLIVPSYHPGYSLNNKETITFKVSVSIDGNIETYTTECDNDITNKARIRAARDEINLFIKNVILKE